MAKPEMKCKDCGKEASKDTRFQRTSSLCNACSSKRWRERQKKKKNKTLSKSEQKGGTLTGKVKKDTCIDCGVAAKDATSFTYKHQLCSKCRQKRYYLDGKSGKIPKSRAIRTGSKKKSQKEAIACGDGIQVIPSEGKEDEVFNFIESQKLPYLEGSVVARICNYNRKRSMEDLVEAFYHLSLLIERKRKELVGSTEK